MSDQKKRMWWEDEANRGIIGLGPEPWPFDRSGKAFPTHGYDGDLTIYDEDVTSFAASGRTRDEWIALADEMIRRWIAWRFFIEEATP